MSIDLERYGRSLIGIAFIALAVNGCGGGTASTEASSSARGAAPSTPVSVCSAGDFWTLPAPVSSIDPHPLYAQLDRAWLRDNLVADGTAADATEAASLLAVPPIQPTPLRSVSVASRAQLESEFSTGNATITVTADLRGQGEIGLVQGENNVVIFQPGAGADGLVFSSNGVSNVRRNKFVGGYFPRGIRHQTSTNSVDDMTFVGVVASNFEVGGGRQVGGTVELQGALARWAVIASVVKGNDHAFLIAPRITNSDFSIINSNIAGRPDDGVNSWGWRQARLNRVLWVDNWVTAWRHKPWRNSGGWGSVATSSQVAIGTNREAIFANPDLGDGPYDVPDDGPNITDKVAFQNLRILIGGQPGVSYFQFGGRADNMPTDQSLFWRAALGTKWITVHAGQITDARLDAAALSGANAGMNWDYGTAPRDIQVGTLPDPPRISHPDLLAAGYANGEPAERMDGAARYISDPRCVRSW